MGKCTTKIKTIEFNIEDEQMTVVTVVQEQWGDCPLMPNVYKKTFPARMKLDEVLKETGNYLDWI